MKSDATSEPNAHPGGTDKRAQRSRATVLAAATELLGSGGVAGFSVDEVARRSGVAKTTIYRHWPTRESLVLAACSNLDAAYDTPDTGTLHADLRAFVADIATMLTEANWAAVLPSIIDAAERSDEFAAVHSEIQRGHAIPVRHIVDRAITRGELPTDTDPAVLAASLLGPLFYRRWFSREPLDKAFLDSIAQQAVTKKP